MSTFGNIAAFTTLTATFATFATFTTFTTFLIFSGFWAMVVLNIVNIGKVVNLVVGVFFGWQRPHPTFGTNLLRTYPHMRLSGFQCPPGDASIVCIAVYLPSPHGRVLQFLVKEFPSFVQARLFVRREVVCCQAVSVVFGNASPLYPANVLIYGPTLDHVLKGRLFLCQVGLVRCHDTQPVCLGVVREEGASPSHPYQPHVSPTPLNG